MSSALLVIVAALSGFAGGLFLRPVADRVLRLRPSLRSLRRELAGPRPGLAFYIVPPGLGDTDEIVAELTAGRRPRLCLIGRLCGPLPYGRDAVPENALHRGALWAAPGLLMFDPRGDAEMSVLEAPYGVDAREPMLTEAGRPVLTLDLGDGVLVFEPAPDTDLEHAWSRIRGVLEDTNPRRPSAERDCATWRLRHILQPIGCVMGGRLCLTASSGSSTCGIRRRRCGPP